MVGGLLGVVTPRAIRELCDRRNEFGPTAGFLPKDVGGLTLDQFLMLCCNRESLRKDMTSYNRVVKATAAQASIHVDSDGMVKGRDGDGNPIKAKFQGKSLARQLMEEEEKKQEAQRQKKRKRKRRKRK